MTQITNKDDLRLYNGDVLLRFASTGHLYKVSIDGGSSWEKKIGVTTILSGTVAKDGLLPWAAGLAADTLMDLVTSHQAQYGDLDDFDTIGALNIAKGAHTARKDAGADIGKTVHSYIEAYIRDRMMAGPMPELPESPEAQKAIAAFMKWEEQYNPHWLKIEHPVYSRDYDYCGTYDALAKINGVLTLLDFKTGNARFTKAGPRAYPEHFVQLGGYSLAMQEETGNAPEQHAVLYVQKDGQTHYFPTTSVESSQDAFVHARALYRHLQELKQ